ncbi:MAG: hypothetical protein K8R68_04620, partial [Bacteroidales bacterium]|nr:hypothetical protein [Bacteroidales bacterium]
EGKHKERVDGIEGEALEKLILKNWRDLITAAAAIRPLIILIEDMHWADTSSITFLESLFKLVKKNQILFINVFRPGHKDTGDFIQEFLNENLPEDHITIKIDPLIETESRKLIGNLLHNSSLPSEVCEMIIRKTEGNPFFIEEVIRSFIDDGIIEIKGNEFIITEKIHQANIPETINEVILSRVDKLDEKTKDLLKTASVIGRNFYYKVLEEAADIIGELDSRIEYLKDVQLIGESKKKEEIEFLFKHALAQQATYESIIQNTKKELHLKIARSIEKVFTENLHEHYGSLAYHYGKAENFEKTEEYLIKAGDEAMKTAASAEAINHYKKVIKIINSDDLQNKCQQKTLDIEEKLAYAYYAQGLNRNASELFIKVLSTSNLSKVPKNRFLLLFKVFKSLIQLNFKIKLSKGEVGKRANDHDNRLLKMVLCQGEAGVTFSPKDTFFRNLILLNGFPIQTLATSNFGIVCLLTISCIFPWTGRGIKYGRMLNRFTSSVMDSQEDIILLYIKYIKAMYDYFVDQLSHDNEDDKVFKLGMETGLVWPPTIYHAYRGVGYIELGRSIETKHLIKNLYQIANDMENSFSRTQHYRVQQTFFIKYRLMDKVIDNSEDIIKFISKTDHSTILLLIHCITSIAYSIKGDINKAKQHFHKAEDLSEKLWLKYYTSMTLLAKAYIEMKKIEISLNKDNSIKDLLLTSKLLVDASKKVNCNKVEAFRIRAIAFNQNNQASKSLKYFKKSIEFANWYGAKLELSRKYFELGKFLSDPKTKRKQLNGLSGKEYLEKARAMFEEMSLQWDLGEYQKYIDD